MYVCSCSVRICQKFKARLAQTLTVLAFSLPRLRSLTLVLPHWQRKRAAHYNDHQVLIETGADWHGYQASIHLLRQALWGLRCVFRRTQPFYTCGLRQTCRKRPFALHNTGLTCLQGRLGRGQLTIGVCFLCSAGTKRRRQISDNCEQKWGDAKYRHVIQFHVHGLTQNS